MNGLHRSWRVVDHGGLEHSRGPAELEWNSVSNHLYTLARRIWDTLMGWLATQRCDATVASRTGSDSGTSRVVRRVAAGAGFGELI